MVHALRSRRVITPHGISDAAVLIDGDCIAAVKPVSELSPEIPVEDLDDVALLPGLVDTHTHINEPGRTEWEGFATATRTAAAGGFTTLVDMPLNCLPETTDVNALEQKREAARGQCLVDYALWGGAVDGNQHELEPLALAGVPGFKSFLIYPGCDGFTAIDRANLELALPHIVRTGLPLLVHAELEPSINAAVAQLNASGADWHRYSTYLASRPDQAELEAIEMLLELCRTYRFRLHIVHLSTAKALPILAAARREGLPVTVETCPHYLHCAAEEIADSATLFKCAPPIRSAANREALWQALRDGLIDLIATDHSPCPPAMKRRDEGLWNQAWGGIASLGLALPVMWTALNRRGIDLAQRSEWVAAWMAAGPARLAGLSGRKGALIPGADADFIVFDPHIAWTVAPKHLHFRHKLSPYLGAELHGCVEETWLRGENIFSINKHASPFIGPPRGKELTRKPVCR